MTYNSIEYSTNGRIATICLNRPERLNAISMEMPREIASAVESANRDDAVHVRMLTGAGHSYKPTIARVHGAAVAGGSDIALCCELVVMAEDARIGYPPVRVWGCPTTAMCGISPR